MNLYNQKNLINNVMYENKINNIKSKIIYTMYVYMYIYNFNLIYLLTKYNNIQTQYIPIILQNNYKKLLVKQIKPKVLINIKNKKYNKNKKFKYIKQYQHKFIYNILNNLENLFIQYLYIQPRVICLNFTILQNSIIVNGIDINNSKILFNTSTAQLGFLHLKNNLMYALESLIGYCFEYIINNNYKNIIVKFKINPFFLYTSYLLQIFKDLFLKQKNNLELKINNINFIDNFLIKNEYENTLNIYFNINRIKIFNGCKLKKERYIKKKQQQQNNFNFFWENININNF